MFKSILKAVALGVVGAFVYDKFIKRFIPAGQTPPVV